MSKLLFILFLVSCTMNCFGQIGDISTKKTDKHINIPGSRAFIIPPKGFKTAKGFIGLQEIGGSMIQVYDLVDGNFYSNSRSMNRENFENNGMIVYDYSKFSFNGYQAIYLYVQGNPLYKSHQMTFGDSTFSAMLMTAFPAEDKEMEKQIRESILTIYYDTTFQIDHSALAEFTIDESLTPFKFYQFNANMYSYTPDGKENSDILSPRVLISQVPIDVTITFESLVESMIHSLKQNTFIHTGTISSTEKTVNGYKAYEKIIKGYLNRKKVTVYYLIFIKNDVGVTFCGISHAEDESDLNNFKKLSSSMKMK